MPTKKLMGLAAVCLAIAGCGGKSQTDVKVCWDEAIPTYAKAISLQPNDAVENAALANELTRGAVLYAKRGERGLRGQTVPPQIMAWFATTQKRCGRLTSVPRVWRPADVGPQE